MSAPEAPQFRTDRVGLLIDQLTTAVDIGRSRLDGMTEDEFLWEPREASWSIRPRAKASSPDAFGIGPHVLDRDRTLDPFSGGPITTIAWRVGHLVSAFAGRWEWTFGDRSAEPDHLVDFVPSLDMVERLWAETTRWVTAIERMTDAELDTPGFGQYPHGLDPHVPFISIIWWMNRETVHHLAEIALLRDLYPDR